MYYSLPKKEKKKKGNRSVILEPDYFGTQMKERIFFKITLIKDLL